MSRRAMAAAAIVIAAVALYAPAIDDYFVQDDFGVVGLFAERSLAYIPRWFVTPWTEDIWGYVPDELRPFPAASYVMTSWFGASSPQPNHVINIALHASNAVLVLLIAESASARQKVALDLDDRCSIYVKVGRRAVNPEQLRRFDYITGCIQWGSLLEFGSLHAFSPSRLLPANRS